MPLRLVGDARPEVTPIVVDLSDKRAGDAELAGTKAAALARAIGLGLLVLPGFVLTTAFGGESSPLTDEEIRDRWEALSCSGRRPLVVRSSSTIEDDLDSSMAGRFTSVVGELAMRLVRVGFVARRFDDRLSFIVGDLMRLRLGHRRFIAEVGRGESLWIASFEPAMETARL